MKLVAAVVLEVNGITEKKHDDVAPILVCKSDQLFLLMKFHRGHNRSIRNADDIETGTLVEANHLVILDVVCCISLLDDNSTLSTCRASTELVTASETDSLLEALLDEYSLSTCDASTELVTEYRNNNRSIIETTGIVSALLDDIVSATEMNLSQLLYLKWTESLEEATMM
eukprot:gene10236-18923_t